MAKLFKKKSATANQPIKSLTARWFIDVLSIIVAVIVIVVIIISITIYNYYYDSARQTVKSHIDGMADILNTYSVKNDSEFEVASKIVLSDYFEKSLFEAQIFDRNGKFLASSQGFAPEQTAFKDYELAKASENGEAEWVSKMNSGESFLAMSKVLPEQNGVSFGAVRLVVSMDDINSAIWNSITIVAIISVAILLVIALSGVLFLRSILNPIRNITDSAFRIATGDFSAKLNVDEKDKSEIGKLCDTINYMATELQSAETLKNDFISSVSHELRTPLTAIKGWGETVKMSLGNDLELTEKGIDVIIKETGRLSGLVEDLLDFSRLESGRLKLKIEPVDMLAELMEAVLIYKEVAQKNGVSLEYIAPENLPPVLADASKLKQVFINIIDNAVKYSSKGDSVTITVSQHDVYIKVNVTDTGCGIAAEDLSKVRKKFYKANTTVPGSGIGLAIADEIMLQLGGLIEIDSKLGQGTSVSLIIPCKKTTENEQFVDVMEGSNYIEQ